MAQGTADLVLEMSSHCWTGEDAVGLSSATKKKIMDFYQRNSMTSYCLAYTYRPNVVPHRKEVDTDNVYFSWPTRYCEDELKWRRKTEHSSADNHPSDVHSALSLNSVWLAGHDCHFREPNSLMENQIFLGMVTLQYQAKPDVVRLVEHLDKACIRFVHFSKENELRSRIFAEKMGLEAGWNCHVSLAPEGSTDPIRSLKTTPVIGKSKLVDTVVKNSGVWRTQSLLEDIYAAVPTQKIEKDAGEAKKAVMDIESSGESSTTLDSDEGREKSPLLSERTSRTSQGDNSDPAYVFPNRAQLPKGVSNVRPHLETKDNVPLLVNLYTDADHSSAREMLEIMQDYGEVVLVLGSSLNFNNADIFSQANASLALEPIHPTRCIQEQEASGNEHRGAEKAAKWANLLSSLPSSAGVEAGAKISLLELLSFARHRLASLRASLIFLFSASIFLCLLRVASLLLFMPPVYDLWQALLWCLLVLPVLGFSLCVGPDSMGESLKLSTPKNQRYVPKKMVRLFCLGLIVKFLPSIVVVLLLYGAILPVFCAKIPHAECWWYMVQEIKNGSELSLGDWGGWGAEFKTGLVVARQVCAFLVSLYLCIISMSFVHYRENLWNCSPLKSREWIVACLVVLSVQIFYSCVAYEISKNLGAVRFSFSDVPWQVCLVGLFWIVPMVGINELYKRSEIKLYRRDQRRRRLSFGTKLGLNSPW